MRAWKTAGAIGTVFIVPCRGVEGRLPLVIILNADKMVHIAQIKLGKKLGSLEKFEGSSH